MAIYNLPKMRIGAVDETTPAFNRAIGNIQRLNTQMGAANQAMNRTAGSMRMMRGGMNQMGYQIQDIAIQLQMGTNPFMVLSQQGSQIASIFGVGGAVLGAFGAIAGAVAMSLLPNLFKTTTELDKMEEAGKKLADRFEFDVGGSIVKLSKKLQGLSDQGDEIGLGLELRAAQEAAGEQLEASYSAVIASITGKSKNLWTKELERFKEVGGTVDDLRKKLTTGGSGMMKTETTQFVQLDNAAQSLSKEFDITKREALKLLTGISGVQDEAGRRDMYEFLGAIRVGADAAPGAAGRLADYAAAIRKVNEATAQDLSTTEGALPGPTYNPFKQMQEVTHDSVMGMIDDIHKLSEEEKLATEKRKEQTESSIWFVRRRLGVVKNALGQESAAGKAAFAAYQGIAIANAIVATHEAANKALAAGPYIGPILSAAALATGYASVGIMAAQTVASFEGGGMTPLGARAGGVDGRGGFTATLHPNEKVVDLDDKPDRGPAQNITINLSALDTNGMERLLNENRGQIIDMVQESARMRGGRF